MSYSSLYLVDKDLRGTESYKFQNSWLFTPIVWDILLNKYNPERKQSFGLKNGEKRNYLSESMFDSTISERLNECLNNSEIISDRILWELCNQQAFFTKNKELVYKSIIEFISSPEYISEKKEQAIFNRFKEIANIIKNLDEIKYPYFIFKNSSVDDGIQHLFSTDDDAEGYKDISLKEHTDRVLDFVVIQDNKIIGWISNLALAEAIKKGKE